MSQSPDIELIIEIARDVLAEIAPDELRSFPAISTLFRSSPSNMRRQQATKDDDLGFGLGETVQALAPSVLLIVQQVLIQLSSDATEKGTETLFQGLRKKFFKRSSLVKPTNQTASLQYQLIDIRAYAYQTAREFRIGEVRANQLADAIVEKLRVRKAEMEKIR